RSISTTTFSFMILPPSRDQLKLFRLITLPEEAILPGKSTIICLTARHSRSAVIPPLFTCPTTASPAQQPIHSVVRLCTALMLIMKSTVHWVDTTIQQPGLTQALPP